MSTTKIWLESTVAQFDRRYCPTCLEKMALETAGGIASIATIIIDVDLDADIGHLERVLRQFQNAESEQQRWQPRNIPDDAQTIVDDCKRLRQRFADKV